MASKSQRIFALSGAILFLITSSFVAIAYILSNIQAHNASNTQASRQAAIQAAIRKTEAAQAAKSGSKTSSTSAANQQGGSMQNFTPVANVSTLQTQDLTVGTGQTVKSGDTVTVDYTGAVAATGKIFQSSSSPVTFPLSGVIAGWQQGIPGMKVGGTRRLLIPANMAYGANPPAGSGIPANAALVFDVTLKAIK